MEIKCKVKSGAVAERRLSLLTDLKFDQDDAQDNLADESHNKVGLEKMQRMQLDIKRERTVGRQDDSFKWTVDIVLLICDLLVNGTPL